jgi:TRAP-type uncharacterized transport system substrate-binding protein
VTSARQSPNAGASSSVVWRGKGFIRTSLLLIAAAALAAVAAAFGIAHDYGYLHASILTGSRGGYYHALATRLAERAKREHGSLSVVPTAGSIENVERLARRDACVDEFALIQDGTPVAAGASLELLGRLPEPESLFLLGRPDNTIHTFADLHGASIGIGPAGSGTAYLMQQLFQGPDLEGLDVHLSNHELLEQARLVAEGKLDLAAMVIQENAESLRTIISQNHLDILSPQDLQGLVARYPWLSIGTIPAGRYDVVHLIPAGDRQVAHLGTLLVAGPCAKRADRIALLMLLGAELPGFVRANPPGATSPATKVVLAAEAHQFFLSGEPEFADRYFPWLGNLMSPAYWVYLVMAMTILFNAMKAYSRFRLWRIDAAREKLETSLKALVEPGLTHSQMRTVSTECVSRQQRAEAEAILNRLAELRARCQRQTSSFVTPMGDEMFYRYQQSLIDEARTTLSALLQRPYTPASKSAVVSLVPEIDTSSGSTSKT